MLADRPLGIVAGLADPHSRGPPGAVLKAVGALKRKRNLAILPTLPNACHFDV